MSELIETDISYTNFDENINFIEAQNTKNEILEYLQNILDLINSPDNDLKEDLNNQALIDLENFLNSVEITMDGIKTLIKSGISQPSFKQSRENYIKSLKTQNNNNRKHFLSIANSIKLNRVNKLVDKQVPGEYNEQLDKILKDAETNLKSIEKIREASQKHSMDQGTDRSKQNFEMLKNKHDKYSRGWFIAFIISAILLFIAIGYSIWRNWDNNLKSIDGIIKILFQKILLISSTIISLKICLNKYNIERNLYILYDHRSTVLNQYEVFENAIGNEDENDKSAKNEFRLEIAKYIFSDPNTGYIADNKDDSLSINPVIKVIEKIVSKNKIL